MLTLANVTHPYIIGTILLLFGIVKITIGFLNMFPPRNLNPKLKKLLSNDNTPAGQVMEFVLLLFGVYTLIHGLSMFGLLGHSFEQVISHPLSALIIVGGLALTLIVFYGMVVFTNLKIRKLEGPAENIRYELLGLGGGLFMLIGLLTRLMVGSLLKGDPIWYPLFGIVFILCIFGLLLYDVFKNKKANIKDVKGDIINIITLPIGSL